MTPLRRVVLAYIASALYAIPLFHYLFEDCKSLSRFSFIRENIPNFWPQGPKTIRTEGHLVWPVMLQIIWISRWAIQIRKRFELK